MKHPTFGVTGSKVKVTQRKLRSKNPFWPDISRILRQILTKPGRRIQLSYHSYHYIRLPGLVKICRRILEMSGQRDFCYVICTV